MLEYSKGLANSDKNFVLYSRVIVENVEISKIAKSCETALLLYTRQRKLLISSLLVVDKNERSIVNID